MPTPSNDHLSRDRPRAFSSTCPDEQPPSPSSWHPLPPHPFNTTAAEEELHSSETTSSRPVSRAEDSPSPATTAPTDDGHDKAPDIADEEMTSGANVDGASSGPERGASATATVATQDGVIRPSPAPRRRQSANTAVPFTTRSQSASQDVVDSREDSEMVYHWEDHFPLEASEYPSLRVIPTSPSSYLRPGSKFCGTQQSERQVYDVQVEIKHVDLRESFLCGYLRIQGLTEDHPTLTTYFEGEIIGTKYSFITKHETWGANDKTDLTHWSKFSAFRPFAKAARKGGVVIKDVAQREHIFMRWKEHFLVPDHRVRTINGASFEGFYYICFNQIRGEVTGIYFHSKSEKFQQLELKHVEDKGCYSALEFR